MLRRLFPTRLVLLLTVSTVLAMALAAGAQVPPEVELRRLQSLQPLPRPPGALQPEEAAPEDRRPPSSREQQRLEEEILTSKRKEFEILAKALLKDRRIDEEEQWFLERKAQEFGLDPEEAADLVEKVTAEQTEIFTYLLDQARALAQDGEISEEDREFLAMRARDRGVKEFEAEEYAERVEEQYRRMELYRSILDSFLEDDILDASEEKLLETRREELDIALEEHEEIVAEAREERRDFAEDVLAEIRRRDETLARMEEEIKLYGRELFQAPPDTFFPAPGLPPPDTYVVGPGDYFRVSLWGRLSEEYRLLVDSEGGVQFPKVGGVRVGGLTYAEARKLLKAKAESITGVSAAVTLDAMRSIQVFVVGEAERPGSATLSPLSSIIHAVMVAGGPTPIGSLRTITQRRGGRVLATLDLYKFLEEGDAEVGHPLQTGDVVVIPRAKKLVKVLGEVRRPAIYELTEGEGMRALLGYAGGLAPDADRDRVQVERAQENRSRLTFDVSLATPEDFPLTDGDVVRVYPLAAEIANKVSLYGHVHQPGTYAFREGMRVSDLVGGPGNLKPEVDVTYAVVLRETGPDRARAVVPFHLGKALDGSEPGEDLALHPRDEVFVFAREQFRPPLRARATGEVRNPGLYRIAEGARVADLVRLAGGLRPDALLSRAEVLRYLPDRVRQTVYVDLKAALAGDPDHNIPLRDEDELVVHKVWDETFEQVVLIEGEVNRYKQEQLELVEQRKRKPLDEARVQRGLSVQERLKQQIERKQEEEEEQRRLTPAVAAQPAGMGAPPSGPLTARQREGARAPADREEEKALAVAVPLTQGMTVRDLVFKAGGLTKEAYLPVAQLYRTEPATRKISIHTFDLGKALEGDPRENLRLHDLDHVVIHSAFEFVPVQSVTVSGMVHEPGEYAYGSNMRVRDLVLAAGGLADDAYRSEAELVRSDVVDGQTGQTRTIAVSLEKAMAGDPEANLPLEPYDKLFVKRIPEWKEARSVDLHGEVLFPGTYFIARAEKLSSLLRRAGGYTSEAYLRGAVFTRESARLLQQQRLDELREQLRQTIFRISAAEVQTALGPEEIEAQRQYLAAQEGLLRRLESVRATGRVVVRLLPLEQLEGTEWDIALEDGDTLTIPQRPQTVTVVGQVYNPTSILWEPDNRSVEHYLYKTGGPTPDAERGRIYVVLADGTVISNQSLKTNSWWSRGIESVELYPGDTILVPEKVLRFAWLRAVKDVTTILYQIALTTGVFITVF